MKKPYVIYEPGFSEYSQNNCCKYATTASAISIEIYL